MRIKYNINTVYCYGFDSIGLDSIGMGDEEFLFQI